MGSLGGAPLGASGWPRLLSISVAAFALGALAPAAQAGEPNVYAAPDGETTAPCTLKQPCAIETAVESAMFEQNILLEGGTYEIGDESLVVDQKNLVRPSTLGSPVTIVATGGTAPTLIARDGSVLYDLTVQSPSSVAAVEVDGSAGSRAERLLVDYAGGGAACSVTNGVIRDSVCRASAISGGAAALVASSPGSDASNVIVRNVTAYADVGYGLVVGQLDSGSLSVDMRNAIFRNGDSGQTDVAVVDSGSGGLFIGVDYSNYASVGGPAAGVFPSPGSADNQIDAPLFTDAAGGDFSQAEGSPTINAGTDVTNELGDLDVGGAPRIQGPAIDIGAYEATPAPPVDTTRPVVRITKKPAKRTRKRTATFRFTASDDTTARGDLEVICTLDRAAEPPCESPRTYRGLKPGRHRFGVQVRDEAGNFSRSGVYFWKVKKRRSGR